MHRVSRRAERPTLVHILKNCNYLAYSSLRSQKRGVWFIFRAVPEKQTTSPPLLRAKRTKKTLKRVLTKYLLMLRTGAEHRNIVRKRLRCSAP
jgi:hypothetical protein